MIRVTCACGKSDEVRDDLAGKKLKCPVCKQQVVVPGEAPLLVDDPPPAWPTPAIAEEPGRAPTPVPDTSIAENRAPSNDGSFSSTYSATCSSRGRGSIGTMTNQATSASATTATAMRAAITPAGG